MSNTNETEIENNARARSDLGNQYRKIGISALAAALPYGGEQKNQRHAPAAQKVLTIRDLEWLIG
jgi:hypothetical protein